MTAIKNGHRPGPSEPYKPDAVKPILGSDGKKALEPKVSIEGRPRGVLLSPDALEDFGLTGPVAVEELRGVRPELSRLRGVLEDFGLAAQQQKSMILVARVSDFHD